MRSRGRTVTHALDFANQGRCLDAPRLSIDMKTLPIRWLIVLLAFQGIVWTPQTTFADATTQKAKSAANLPPGNDFATLVALGPHPKNVPLCAHWHPLYLNSVTTSASQRHGQIAGMNGDRIYIHKANPQLCQTESDDGCGEHSYLIPGDSVDVGMICGAWTAIQYETGVRSRPSITGWVRTDRLYNVDPIMAVPAMASVGSLPSPNHNALLAAISSRDIGQAERLLASGANPDGDQKSEAPLNLAVREGDLEISRILLQHGANPNIPNEDGLCSNPLIYAPYNQKLFELVVKAGGNLNCLVEGNWKITLLMNAAAGSRLDSTNRLVGPPFADRLAGTKRLLDAGVDPNVRGLDGTTALFKTLESNNVDIAETLLNRGANPNIHLEDTGSAEARAMANYWGSTPLMQALWWYPLTWDPTMIQILLDHGADPNYRNGSEYDPERGHGLGFGRDFAGQTALTKAAQVGFLTVTRLLLAHGANPELPRADGALPADIARHAGHPAVAALIESYVKKH